MSISDSAAAAAGAAEPADGDSVLQSAVWLAQDLAIDPPPIPDLYADALEEVAVGRLYATDRRLLGLDSRGAIADALTTGWPPSGLAFGYVSHGRWGLWFYTLVSEQQIIHISLRMRVDSDEGMNASAAFVTQAHALLQRYLGNEANYYRATMGRPASNDIPRSVIAYTDDDYEPAETRASWQPGGTLSEFVARSEVFSQASEIDAGEMVLRA
jgi:hypothetical protein